MPFTDSEVSPAFEAGSQVANYLIAEEIGRGGTAVVYRARDVRLDRWVALKILSADVARNRAFRQRFIRESKAAAAVDHPNILPVFDAGESDGVYYMAMRYVGDRDLGSLIDRVGPLPLPRAVSMTAQVASALDAAHASGLVHRDVKPANILLGSVTDNDTADHVYLSDFGISLLAGMPAAEVRDARDRIARRRADPASRLTMTEEGLGTVHYAAPEQILGADMDGRADAYSLACVFFEMLTGRPPFSGEYDASGQLAQFSQSPPAVIRWRRDLPPAIDEVLAKALSVRPEDRYGSCRALASALAEACGLGAETEDQHPAVKATTPDRRRRFTWAAAGVAGVAVLAAAGGAWTLLHQNAAPRHAHGASKTIRAVSAGARPATPAATVESFIAAIDQRDYSMAWRLWGIRDEFSYPHFVKSYATTMGEYLRISSVSGDAVKGNLTVLRTNGTLRHSHARFVVHRGAIIAMSLTPYAVTSSAKSAAPRPKPATAPSNSAGSESARNANCPAIATADISADCYTESEGTTTVVPTLDPSPDGVDGNQVLALANGQYLEYPDINFGSGSDHFTARVACGAPSYASGGVEVVLDNPSNKPVTGFSLANTGGWNSWESVGSNMSEVTGIHNVYIVLASGGPIPYLSLHYFYFGS